MRVSMLARPSLAHAGGGVTRVCLGRAYDVARASLYAHLGGDACIFSRAYEEDDAGIFLDARQRRETRASIGRACLELCSCTGRCRHLEPLVVHSCAM